MAGPNVQNAAAAAHDAAQAGGVFPPFDPSHMPSQLIWLAITFGVLYILMSRVALPRVKDILENRSTKISGDLDAAAAMQSEANAASIAFEKTLAEAKSNAQALAQQAQAKVAAEADAKRHALEAELNTKLVAAEAQIGEMKAKAMANVGSIASDAASAIVQQLTGKAPSADAVAAAVANVK